MSQTDANTDEATGSVSMLIARLKDGDESALARLHQRYWPALVNLGRVKLRGAPIRAADEEDVAQKAFVGFYDSVRNNRVPDLSNRHELLALLSHIVACKALNEIKREMAQKRGGGQPRSDLLLGALATEESSPAHQAILNDSYQYYLTSLPESLRAVAARNLAGMTNREISDELGVSERTVERKMALLKTRWQSLARDSIDRNVSDLLPV